MNSAKSTDRRSSYGSMNESGIRNFDGAYCGTEQANFDLNETIGEDFVEKTLGSNSCTKITDKCSKPGCTTQRCHSNHSEKKTMDDAAMETSAVKMDSEKTPLLLPDRPSEQDHNKSGIYDTLGHSKCRRHCTNFMIIVSLIMSAINIGIHSSILGPSLPDLAVLTNSTIPEASVIIAGNGAAFILGSIVAGLLLEFVEGFFIVAAGFLLQGIILLVAFTFTDLLTLASIYSVAQFFATLGIAGVSVLCFTFPRRQAQILVQVVFMMINVGKTVAPFIVTPFISLEIADVTINSTTDDVIKERADVIGDVQVTHISRAYVIIASFSISLSILNIAIFFVRGQKFVDWKRRKIGVHNKPVTMATLGKYRRPAMLATMAVMMCLISGMESSETSLLTSYFSEYLYLDKTTSVHAAAFYQGIKIFFSILVLAIVRLIHPSTLLFFDLVFILLGSLGMTLAVWRDSGINILWFTVALISAGFSNYLATQVSWLEIWQPISGKLAPMFSLALGLGGLVLPPLVTRMLSSFGPLSYPLVFTVVTSIAILLFVITKFVVGESVCPSNKDIYKAHDPADLVVSCSESPNDSLATIG